MSMPTLAARLVPGALTALTAFAGIDAARAQPQYEPVPLVVPSCAGRAGTLVGVGKTTCRNLGSDIAASQRDMTWGLRRPFVNPGPSNANIVVCRAGNRDLGPDIPDGGGAWVEPVSIGNVAPGDYFYTLTFNLPEAPSSYQSIVLGGVFSAADWGTLKLNDRPLASCQPRPTPPGTTTCTGERVHYGTTDAGLLNAGANTLEFYVKNDSHGTGLYATFFISAMCAAEKDAKPK